MDTKIHVPDIGTDELEVTEILVSVGDKIEKEQSLITVEGSKASIEIPAPYSGRVKYLKVNIGDKVRTDSLIMILDVPNMDRENITLSEKNHDKNINISAININENKIEITKKDTEKRAPSYILFSNKNKDKYEFSENDAYLHATPLVRRLARQFCIDLGKIKGSGRKGRILREDVQEYIKKMIKRAEDISNNTNVIFSSWPQINFKKFGDTEEIERNKIQKNAGTNLHRNWTIIPHVTQFDEADITDLEIFRKQQNILLKRKTIEIKITLLTFIMKAVAKALKELPHFNSSLSADSKKLILKKYIHIGVAVETIHGLLVPVFQDVNKKNIIELSYEMTEKFKKARDGKLTPSDMQGGCFTISSLGNVGGTAFTPIINAPEVAILGISKSSIKPMWNNEKFIPRLILPLSLSFDHRVIDGADGVRFIKCVNNIISDIRLLLM